MKNIEDHKVDAMEEFIDHVEGAFNGMAPEFKNKVANRFMVGFSDDDETNTDTMKDAFEDVQVFSTKDGKKERVTESRFIEWLTSK